MEVKLTSARRDDSIESFLQSLKQTSCISTMSIAGVLYKFRLFMQSKAPGYLQKTELDSLEDLASKLGDFFVKKGPDKQTPCDEKLMLKFDATKLLSVIKREKGNNDLFHALPRATRTSIQIAEKILNQAHISPPSPRKIFF